MEELSVFAKRLKTARMLKGLSMDNLVAEMGGRISKMAVSKYETGKMMPDSGVLIELSKALGQKVDYFFRSFEVSLGQIDFRKRSSLPVKKEKIIRELVRDFAERYIETENITGEKSTLDLPQKIHVKTISDARIAAGEVLRKWKIGRWGINSVIELLEIHSVKVYELDAHEKFDGMCADLGKYGAVIVINKNATPERKRFTALHELGHLVLEFDKDASDKDRESLCHCFANEMLLPENLLIEFLGKERHDISYQELRAIQIQYGISIDAIMYKAKACGIISERRYTYYNIQKSKNVNFRKMVERSCYPDSHASRFVRLVYKALCSELITLSKAATLLNEPVQNVSGNLALV